jgi:hypothetical protein
MEERPARVVILAIYSTPLLSPKRRNKANLGTEVNTDAWAFLTGNNLRWLLARQPVKEKRRSLGLYRLTV